MQAYRSGPAITKTLHLTNQSLKYWNSKPKNLSMRQLPICIHYVTVLSQCDNSTVRRVSSLSCDGSCFVWDLTWLWTGENYQTADCSSFWNLCGHSGHPWPWRHGPGTALAGWPSWHWVGSWKRGQLWWPPSSWNGNQAMAWLSWLPCYVLVTHSSNLTITIKILSLPP